MFHLFCWKDIIFLPVFSNYLLKACFKISLLLWTFIFTPPTQNMYFLCLTPNCFVICHSQSFTQLIAQCLPYKVYWWSHGEITLLHFKRRQYRKGFNVKKRDLQTHFILTGEYRVKLTCRSVSTRSLSATICSQVVVSDFETHLH